MPESHSELRGRRESYRFTSHNCGYGAAFCLPGAKPSAYMNPVELIHTAWTAQYASSATHLIPIWAYQRPHRSRAAAAVRIVAAFSVRIYFVMEWTWAAIGVDFVPTKGHLGPSKHHLRKAGTDQRAQCPPMSESVHDSHLEAPLSSDTKKREGFSFKITMGLP